MEISIKLSAEEQEYAKIMCGGIITPEELAGQVLEQAEKLFISTLRVKQAVLMSGAMNWPERSEARVKIHTAVELG